MKFSFKNHLPDSSRLYAKQVCKLPHSKVKVIEISHRPHVQNLCLFNAISVPGLILNIFYFYVHLNKARTSSDKAYIFPS